MHQQIFKESWLTFIIFLLLYNFSKLIFRFSMHILVCSAIVMAKG